MKNQQDMVSITDADLERFHRNAHAAIARREGDFMAREIARGIEQIIAGLLPLVGVWLLGWSATEMLIFFLARMWAGILCDLLKLCLLNRAIMQFATMKYDDWHVWVVAQALRDKQKKVMRSHLRAEYQPWVGVFVDFTFGIVGTVVIWISLTSEIDLSLDELLQNTSFIAGIAFAVLYQIGMTFLEIGSHAIRPSSNAQVVIASGARGLGLFLLMFVAVMAHESIQDGKDVASWIMYAVNGSVVFAGLLNIFGFWIVTHETNWLRKYLREKKIDT